MHAADGRSYDGTGSQLRVQPVNLLPDFLLSHRAGCLYFVKSGICRKKIVHHFLATATHRYLYAILKIIEALALLFSLSLSDNRGRLARAIKVR